MISGGRVAALQAHALLEANEGFLVTKGRTKGGTAKFFRPGWLAIAVRGVFFANENGPLLKKSSEKPKRSVLIVKEGYQKYRPFPAVNLKDRHWPDARIEKAPIWCSVDLRDGNQALVNPMNLEEKVRFFRTLVDIGFKEIEVGFPSASETEYEILRTLIEQDLIPDDVTIQVLVQARPHLIRKTFDAIHGAKNVIVHFYNSTSTLQRKVVFKTGMQGVIDIAVEGARLIRQLTEEEMKNGDIHIRYEYSPESFSGTEPENAVLICDRGAGRTGRYAGQQSDPEPAQYRRRQYPQPPRRPD